jgi:hypothetical protein
VPGYDDTDIDDNEPLDTLPLSRPLPGYKLLTYQYDSLDSLIKELSEWAIEAGFSIRKLRVNNKVKDFGYTRVDFYCTKDKIRPSEAITG